ncbi:MAG: sigma factor [Gemmiger sp.]
MENRNTAPPDIEPSLNRERSQRTPAEQPAGQQAVNAALATLAASGDSFALGQLWEINRGLLHKLFWRWFSSNKKLADAHGMTAEDFEQEGFFAVEYAAKTYCPEAGSFSTWLGQAVQRQINQALIGDHRRTVTGSDGKRRTVSANPLNHKQRLTPEGSNWQPAGGGCLVVRSLFDASTFFS